MFKLELSPFPHKQIFFEKEYNHKHELPVAAMFVNGSGQSINKQGNHRRFLFLIG
jgi:hypothetical protein